MATARARVKIKIADLIKNIEKQIENKKAKYEKELAKYEEDKAKYDTKFQEVVTKVAEKLLSGDFKNVTSSRAWGSNKPKITIENVSGLPNEPSKPHLSTSKEERDLKILKMTDDETISVSTNSDWAEYI